MGLLANSNNQEMQIPCADCKRAICNLKECRDFAQYERYYLEQEKQSLRKKHFVFRLTAIFSFIGLCCLLDYAGFLGFVLNGFFA
jgi:hypothetical protein